MSEDMTQLEVAAAQLHEMFTSLLLAGFTEEQAIKLVGAALGKMMEQ